MIKNVFKINFACKLKILLKVTLKGKSENPFIGFKIKNLTHRNEPNINAKEVIEVKLNQKLVNNLKRNVQYQNRKNNKKIRRTKEKMRKTP